MLIDRRTALLSLAGFTLVPVIALAEPQGKSACPFAGAPVAMRDYPEMTALGLAGPHHFLGATGARIELVTPQRDLGPASSDPGLAILPTATFETCPEDVTLLFLPGGTRGTIAAEFAGQDEAEGILLVSEYDPEPPFPGGSLARARPGIPDVVSNGGLPRFVAEAQTLRIQGS